MTRRTGFTLIELLIVVAIIAILAAIAVPNFLEAQTRSRVSRAVNDLRTISLGMESYRVDNNGYPACDANSPLLGHSTRSEVDKRLLTTPISYVASVPDDVFRKVAGMDVQDVGGGTGYRIYAVGYHADTSRPEGYYRSFTDYPHTAWMTWSIGPDNLTNTDGYRPLGRVLINESTWPMGIGVDKDGNTIGATGSYYGLRYDATNGTTSFGDVYRFEGDSINRVN